MSVFSKASAGQSHATAAGPSAEMPYSKDESNYVEIAATRISFRVYKRRFFGLTQLVLLNIIISWDVRLSFAGMQMYSLMLTHRNHSGSPSPRSRRRQPNIFE